MFVSNINIFLPSMIFFIALVGVHRSSQNNLLIALISLELMFLSINLQFLLLSNYLDDMLGQVFSLFIIALAACESAIALALIVVYYRFRRTVKLYSHVAYLKLV